ncbi:NifU family protein [Parvularcula dongshanensis]|uniref:Fe-S cluster biogenesis protein NfuA n=1 Tax=Parvularcula dongshanensis TaxID=1173995 RepID=A0A840I224_9PROT|nr:NifU family protein [Parvularcula dongshanensis]MBB4658110.1 Fe-S cluster biogenesis protein NfuA [Parvularcula dongshanensis]
MFIETAPTPNPQSLKFLPGQAVLGGDALGMDFPTPETAKVSPLATALYDVDGVTGVYLGADFVTVTKDASVEWHDVKPALLGTIADYLAAGIPVVDPSALAADNPGGDLDDYEGEDREVVEQIVELLDTRVRPAVAQDGGDIVFHRFVPGDGIVYLTMRGSCAGCPSSTMTLKAGIENLLKHYVPEVTSVEAVG